MKQDHIFCADEYAVRAISEYLPNDATLNDLCEFFGVFSDITRVKIVVALAITELCVNDLSAILGINQTTTSHQLKILRDADIVTYRRDGKIIFYRINNKYINALMLTG
ncbi:MAG: metalloregulator ArsR/SmtB family transcription factor, partial [Christensenellaceae bacterium]|nr:metalloregulator ArsR/SmtB family transcription factor [Christensenellaceae bacterium]